MTLGCGVGGDVPIPQGDDEFGHVTQRVAKFAGEAKVGDLDLAAVVHQQVGSLEIAMQLVVSEVGERYIQSNLSGSVLLRSGAAS